jgi:hypothetical protein
LSIGRPWWRRHGEEMENAWEISKEVVTLANPVRLREAAT